MKVAVLINFIPPYQLPLLSLLNKRVTELRVFISTKMEANRSWGVKWGGLNVIQQKTLTWTREWIHPSGFSDLQYVHFPLDTIALLFSFRPDVVITTELGTRSLGAILYKMIRRKTRVFLWLNMSERTEEGRGWARGHLRRFILHLSDAVFINGESGERYLRRVGVPEALLYRLPYPTDAATFAQGPLDRSELSARRLLYVGQLVPRKGLLPFLSTLCRWASSHPAETVEFTIVGEGPLRQAIEHLKMPSNVHLTLVGKAAYEDLPRYYQNSGILVFPTLADEWGIVVNEALASGLPILGSIYSQATEDMVQEGVTGWLLRPDDPTQASAALDKAMSTPTASLASMREACRARALQYRPDRVIEAVLRALESDRGRL